MLSAKGLINAKLYTKNGVHPTKEFKFGDNLIIKGNNLLTLISLIKRFRKQVKCIFIDPPYYFVANKPSDTFSYNSNFKLSSWLVFMRNRLVEAYKLLSDQGVLFISISDQGAHYLKVMADDIFKMDNFIADVTWESRKSISSDGYMSENSTHILVYAKKLTDIQKNNFRLALDVESFTYDDNDGRGKYRLEPFDAPGIRENLTYIIKNPNTGEEYLPPKGRHWRTEYSNYQAFLKDNRIRFGANGTTKPQLKAYYNELKSLGKGKAMSTIWHNVEPSIIWQELDPNTNATKDQVKIFGESVFSNPKPEDLVERAIELSTKKGDYVLDFFMGSATTPAVALKTGRKFIGCEQMDYIETVSVPRLQKVIAGEQSGISKKVNWRGGGSFVYCELAKLNEQVMEDIETATTDDEIPSIWDKMKKTGYISYKVKPSEIDSHISEFKELTLTDKKKFLMDVLDKNMLYVNYCDIDDEEYGISEEDKAFNHSFYGED